MNQYVNATMKSTIPIDSKMTKNLQASPVKFCCCFFPRALKNSTYIRYIRQLYSKTSQTSKIKHFVKVINVF